MHAHSTSPITEALSREIQSRERIQFQLTERDRQYQNEYLAGLMEAEELTQVEAVDRSLRAIVLKSEATSSSGRAAGLRSARLTLACAAASALRAMKSQYD